MHMSVQISMMGTESKYIKKPKKTTFNEHPVCRVVLDEIHDKYFSGWTNLCGGDNIPTVP